MQEGYMDWLTKSPVSYEGSGFLLQIRVAKDFIPIRIKCHDKNDVYQQV